MGTLKVDTTKDQLNEETKRKLRYLIDKASNVSQSVNDGASSSRIGYDFGFFHIEFLNIILPLIRKEE